MTESSVTIDSQFRELFKQEFVANSMWPQMQAPKALSLGSVFLSNFNEGKMTYEEFVVKEKGVDDLQTDFTKVKALHNIYGRKRSRDTSINEIALSYWDSKIYFADSLRAFTGISTLEHLFKMNDVLTKNIQTIYSKVADSLSMKNCEIPILTENYRESFTPYLEKGLVAMSEAELLTAIRIWGETTQKLSKIITDSANAANSELNKPFAKHNIALFLRKILKDGITVENKDHFVKKLSELQQSS